MSANGTNGHGADGDGTNMRQPPRAALPEPAYATAGALAGLARQVDTLRRDLARDTARIADEAESSSAAATTAGKRVDELAGVVAALADVVAGIRTVTQSAPPVSWLRPLPISDGGRDPAHVLTELCVWVARVYLRYTDARSLPPCWLWHPDVVEELCWLHQAWEQAYRGDTASVQAAGDWHDRQRPGVAARITKSTGSCSIEVHQTPPPLVPEAAPLASAAAAVAAWMTAGHTATPPIPTEEQVREAAAVHAAQRRTGKAYR